MGKSFSFRRDKMWCVFFFKFKTENKNGGKWGVKKKRERWGLGLGGTMMNDD